MNDVKKYGRSKTAEWSVIVASIVVLITTCVSFEKRNIITTKIEAASVFSSNMVLQAGKPVPVWGKGEPGRTIQVSFKGQHKTAQVDKNGTWRVSLDPLHASKDPEEMVIGYLLSEQKRTGEGGDLSRTFRNVLVGEVWFCSGQSNMAMGMSGIADRRNELRDTDYPAIRLFLIPENASPFPLTTIPSIWIESNREDVVSLGWKGFSAVAFTFGRKLYHELDIPIGLVLVAYSGSSIHPWIPPGELKSTPVLSPYYKELEEADNAYERERKKNKQAKHPFADIFDYKALKPATLYHAMVAPVVPFALQGVLWYQGESNIGDGMIYADKLKALITGWRRVFNQGDFPFYYVQLPPYNYGSEGLLPRMWEAQEACLSIPNTGMAVSVDVGDEKDIHPTRKREIGERLALIAMAKTYGKTDMVYSGPVFREMKIEKGTAVIYFDHTDGGLVSGDGGPLSWFNIAGQDMRFVPAEAVIRDHTVIVRSDKVENPVAVRFAWSNTASPNLFNRQGLPARPFRTDK